MQSVEEQQILQVLCRDPQKGLTEILDQYGGILQAVIRRILHDPRDVEECIADVLVQCWRKAQSLQAQQISLKGWLIVTARNKAVDRYRQLKREQTDSLPEDFERIVREWENPDRSEAEELMAELVEELEPPDREIFIRRYYGLESGREIGLALHMEEHAVNVRLSRGRARLKQKFLQRFGKEKWP